MWYSLGVNSKNTHIHTPKCYLSLIITQSSADGKCQMFDFINAILLRFRSCFSRQSAYDWFVIIIIGFLVHSDSLGVTSIIRNLALMPSLYHEAKNQSIWFSISAYPFPFCHVRSQYDEIFISFYGKTRAINHNKNNLWQTNSLKKWGNWLVY